MCCKKCLCERAIAALKRALAWLKNNPFPIAIVFGAFGFVLLLCGFWSEKDLFTASAAAFAAAALMYGANCYQIEFREKRSEFYLNNIRECFKQAVLLIEEGGNNNTKWHQAIRSLTTAVDLLPRLTEDPHKEIYLNDYINTAFSIVNKIVSIDSFKFFYGVPNYENENEMFLYQKSDPPPPAKLERTCPRILPEALAYLCRFISKAHKASYDNEINGTPLIKCINSEYFHSPPLTRDLPRPDESTIRNLTGISKVIEYLDSYEKCQNEQHPTTRTIHKVVPAV